MERESQAGVSAVWLTRYALPQATQPMLVALETSVNRRALLLPLLKASFPARRDWPQCRGLEVWSLMLASQPHLGVRLLDPAYSDVFTVLAEDVAPRVAAAPSPRAAASTLISRLRRWQKFLVAGTGGLSVEQQRGLYGELHTMKGHLMPALGAAGAVAGWRAPKGAHQDFQFVSGAVEIKTTTAKQPQSVRITSERQLDDTGIPALFLHVVVLDEREVEGEGQGGGESLPEIVKNIRMRLNDEQEVKEAFDDLLLESGYTEADIPRYENRRYMIRRENTFHIRQGFPRLIERTLAAGVGDISYSLSLAACEPFAESVSEMIVALKMCFPQRSRNRR
jgi:hypothetical protein